MKGFLEACFALACVILAVTAATALAFAGLAAAAGMGLIGLVILAYRAACLGVAALKPENDC